MSIKAMIFLIPLLPLLGFVLIATIRKRLVRGFAALIGCGSVFTSFIFSLVLFIKLLNGAEPFNVTYFSWIAAGNFSASFSYLIDPLSSLMLLIITGIGFLIHIYSIGYMWKDEGFNRFFSYLNLFVFFMLLLVMGSNYLLMYVGWEGVGLCSYLLIGFWSKNQDYNDAANKAFIMNRIGDLSLIIGVILIFINYGSINYADVFPKVTEGSFVLTVITVLLFIGATGKSAQIPLYTWLPDAMAGPTPVSALIHAATMVTAGVYMVARNNILYTLSPVAMELVLVIGLATALFAATIALAQNDIKKVLAYSTVSQLGLMFVALGVGAYASGIFHMATHAFFKALLFLGAGSVIHALHHEQDIRNMGGLRKYIPITFFTFLVGVLAISGIPPFAGFFSKDEILAKAFEHNQLAWLIAVIASLLTVFYMFRLLFITFYGKNRSSEETIHHIHESPASITIPLIVLAVLSAAGGFMGVPEILGGSNWIEHFLSPVFAKSHEVMTEYTMSHTTEYVLMGVIVVFTLVMIALAYVRYVSRARVPASEGSELSVAHRIIYHKYYIDEFYESIVVKPFYWISKLFDIVIEKSGIDRLVNLISESLQDWSNRFRKLQNGYVGFYIFIMVIGVILVIAYSFLK
ncbi:MAG: NADH-ubiquinone oxidoreductase chain L [Cytophagales bacterium]|jgi:NADH-quinone oxidoreductase subunit L|nr:MAG: NADH-ubiquinone oxidoreductase chain L [Cytophagales bacterium]